LSRALNGADDVATPIEVWQELVELMGRRMGHEAPMPRRLSNLLVAAHVKKDDVVTSIADCTERLETMDRYERRALSRRKFAIREFDAAR
jgi:hypothetical protein